MSSTAEPRGKLGDVVVPGEGTTLKVFHGWRMVGAAGALQFLQAGLLQQSFGAYVAVIGDEKGWSKTSLSGAAAMQSAEAAILGPLLGWIIDRFGPRGMIRAGVLLFGLGFMLLSRVESLGGFYASVAVIAVGASLCGFFPLTVAVIQWFSRKRARALATIGLGLALGGIFVPVVAWFMEQHGWRMAALASGIVLVVVGWPLAGMMRSRPEDHGQHVDGVAAPTHADDDDTESAREFSAFAALRTRAFWLLAGGHGMALVIVMAVNVHAISHMKEGLGFSLSQASLVITLMTIAQVAGVAVSWWIGDRFDKCRLAAGCMVMHCVGLLLLTYATNLMMVVGFALLHGLAWGLRGPLMQAIRADYFGRQAIGMIVGLSTIVAAIGQIAGPMVAGLLADATGNYRAGFTVLAAVASAGALAFAAARRPA